ncbi:unnamed protein product [Heligmosomoides polygyrus]|uniref:Uncharacterized protein n=1 Tax=Heligmosomoides polygyrus TaxID=6339 RepID=A0A183FBC1_HELPZ|nr:unnamed protein product [Heligmosomoides polygyrus]
MEEGTNPRAESDLSMNDTPVNIGGGSKRHARVPGSCRNPVLADSEVSWALQVPRGVRHFTTHTTLRFSITRRHNDGGLLLKHLFLHLSVGVNE